MPISLGLTRSRLGRCLPRLSSLILLPRYLIDPSLRNQWYAFLLHCPVLDYDDFFLALSVHHRQLGHGAAIWNDWYWHRHGLPRNHGSWLHSSVSAQKSNKRRVRSKGLPDKGIHWNVRMPVSILDVVLMPFLCIIRYKEAYTNPNLTTWKDYGQPWPKNRLASGGC